MDVQRAFKGGTWTHLGNTEVLESYPVLKEDHKRRAWAVAVGWGEGLPSPLSADRALPPSLSW